MVGVALDGFFNQLSGASQDHHLFPGREKVVLIDGIVFRLNLVERHVLYEADDPRFFQGEQRGDVARERIAFSGREHREVIVFRVALRRHSKRDTAHF